MGVEKRNLCESIGPPRGSNVSSRLLVLPPPPPPNGSSFVADGILQSEWWSLIHTPKTCKVSRNPKGSQVALRGGRHISSLLLLEARISVWFSFRVLDVREKMGRGEVGVSYHERLTKYSGLTKSRCDCDIGRLSSARHANNR